MIASFIGFHAMACISSIVDGAFEKVACRARDSIKPHNCASWL
jgi:hypothetical protein